MGAIPTAILLPTYDPGSNASLLVGTILLKGPLDVEHFAKEKRYLLYLPANVNSSAPLDAERVSEGSLNLGIEARKDGRGGKR